MITQNDLRNILRHRCEAAGSQRKFAREIGFSAQFVCDVLQGRRHISSELAEKIGYRRKIVFFPCSESVDKDEDNAK